MTSGPRALQAAKTLTLQKHWVLDIRGVVLSGSVELGDEVAKPVRHWLLDDRIVHRAQVEPDPLLRVITQTLRRGHIVSLRVQPLGGGAGARSVFVHTEVPLDVDKRHRRDCFAA